ERDVGDVVRAEQACNGIDAQAADGERRLVDVGEVLVETIANANVRPARVLKAARELGIEQTESRARRQNSSADRGVAASKKSVVLRVVLCVCHARANEDEG